MKVMRGNASGKAELVGQGFLVNPGQIDLGTTTVANFATILASFRPGELVLGQKIRTGFQYVFTVTGSSTAANDGTMPYNDYNDTSSCWNNIASGASRTYMMEVIGTAQNCLQKLTRLDTGQVATRPYYSGAFQAPISVTPTVTVAVWPAMWAIDGQISASGLSGTNYTNGSFVLNMDKRVEQIMRCGKNTSANQTMVLMIPMANIDYNLYGIPRWDTPIAPIGLMVNNAIEITNTSFVIRVRSIEQKDLNASVVGHIGVRGQAA